MRYPQPFLDRIRQHFRLSEVVGRKMALRRAGREWSGLCPFHEEKTPSFTVNDEKGFFHCFGCGAHGDVIGFVKDAENRSYRESIEYLASQAGISLPQVSPEAKRQMERGDLLHHALEAAASWFSLQLRQIAGENARKYLFGRGLDEETIREFRLGFAPDRRNALKDAMLQRGISESLLLEVGLLVKPEQGGDSYDKFRGRIVFPIQNVSGRVIAFGGRLMDPEAKGPKYLNSPETALFHKSHTLYHFDVARREASRAGTLLMAEGYMDVIALAQAGLAHSVAPLGTAVTAQQLAMAWQTVDEPTLCLDGDSAGFRAMERVVDLALPLLKPGKSLRFVRLPKGEDPDSLLRKHGAEGVRRFLEKTEPLSDMLWQKYAARKVTTPEQLAGLEQTLMRAVETIKDRSVQNHYKAEMRDRLYRHRSEMRRPAPNRSAPPNGRSISQNSFSFNPSPSALISPDANVAQARDRMQQTLLALASYYPQLLDDGLDESLGMAEFSDPDMMELRDALLACHANGDRCREAVLRLVYGGAKAQAFLKQVGDSIGKGLSQLEEGDGLSRAVDLRQRLEARLELIHLQEEYAVAETEFAKSMDERDWQRLESLRSRLQDVRDHREFFPEKDSLE